MKPVDDCRNLINGESDKKSLTLTLGKRLY